MFDNVQRGTPLVCQQCNKTYYLKDSSKIKRSKYCSNPCKYTASRINDLYPNKNERYARKHGITKFGSPEYLQKMSETTKVGMQKPEAQKKMHAKRSPLSNDHKSKISKKLAGRMPSNMQFSNNGYGHFQNGDYENSKGTMYFRSKWEANIALYLDFLVVHGDVASWEFEPEYFVFDQIRHGTTRYLPDFKVTNKDGTVEYWEVKGYMDARSKTKLKRMKKYYPQIKLVLLDKDVYNSIKKNFGKLLKFY